MQGKNKIMFMTFEAILKDLNNKIYHPVYFLQGEEAYFIDVISNYIADNVLGENEKAFNQTILYGKETNVAEVLSCAKRYPMMSDYQVVIIKEAQELKNVENLVSYIENPLKSTLLVICYKEKPLDKRTKLVKTLNDKAIIFTSEKLYENKIPAWIVQYLSSKKYTIESKATYLLTEYLGNDLSKVANELNKLMLNTSHSKEITVKDIEDNIGISKDFNVFELNDALGKKNILKANQIINYFASNPKDNRLFIIIGSLYNYFTKLLLYHFLSDKSKTSVANALKINPFFVADYQLAAKNYEPNTLVGIISHLREYDLRSKGINNVSASEGELLKELIYKILHYESLASEIRTG